MIKRVLITGADGFVGTRACQDLNSAGFEVIAAIRGNCASELKGVSCVIKIGELSSTTDWSKALYNIDAVVHLAAHVHQMKNKNLDSINEYRRVNVQATECLLKAAQEAKVKRFVYVSSIKVLGEGENTPYTDNTKVYEHKLGDPYSISKWEAEQLFHKLDNSKMDWVILRPPLVYGPGVKANFYKLMSAVNRGIPLPFGGVKNKRSLLFVGNLTNAMCAALNYSHEIANTFLVSDGEDLSTAQLINKIAEALDRPVRLVSVPPSFLSFVGKLTGRTDTIQRLVGNYTCDISGIREKLGWEPPYSVTQGMREAALAFKHQANGRL